MSDYVSPDTAMRFAKVVGSTTAPPPFRIHILDGSGSMRDDWNRPITHRTRWMNATEVAHSIGHEVCYVFGSHIYYGSPKSVRFPCEMTNFNIAFETLLAEIRKIDASAFPLVDIFFHSDGQHTEGKLRLFEDGGILPRIRSVIDDKRLRTRVHIIGYGDSFPVEALCGPIKSQLETHPTEHMLFQVKDGCLVEDLPLEEIIASRQSLFTIPPNIAATGLYGQPVTEANAGTVVLVDGSHLEEEEAPDSSPNSCGGVSFEPVTNHELMLALQGASKRVLWCINAKRGEGVVEPFEEILRFAVQSTMGTPRDDDRMTVRDSVAARKRGREIGIFADHIRGQIRRLTDDVGRNRILRGREIASLIRCDTSSLLSSRHLDDALRRKGVSNFDRDLALFRSGVARGILASGGGEEVVVSRFSLEGWEDMLHAMMDESFEEADLYKLIGVGIPAMRTSLPDFVKQQPFGLPGSRMFKGIANGTFAYVDVCNLMARMENLTEGYRDPQTQDNPFNTVVLVAEERFKPLFLSNLGRMMTTSSSIELHAAIDLDAHFAQLSCFSLFLLHQPASEWIESMLGRVATTMRFYSERMDAEGNIVENAVMRRYIDALTSADEERTMQALRKKAMWEGIAIEPDVLARLRRKEIRNEDLPEDMRPNPAWSPTLLKPAGVLIAFAERFTPEARKVCLRGMAKAWVHRIWQQNPVHEAWFRLDGSNAKAPFLNTSVPTLEELGLAGDRLNESADTVSQVPSIIRKEVTRFFSRQGTGYDVKLRNRLNLEAGTASTIYRINLEAGSATTISIPFKDFRKLCEHFDCEEVIEELSVHGLAWLVEASGESRVSICNTIISNMMQSAREEAIAQLSLAGEALWARNHERIHSDELRGVSDGVYPFPSKEAFAGWCSRYGIEDEWDPATGYPKRTCMYCRKTFADRDTFFAHLRGAHVVTDARGRVRRVRQAGAFSSATLCEAFSRALTKFVKERDRIPMTPTSLRKFLAKHYREAVKSVENFKTYAGEDETDESLAQHIQTALQLVA